jgi:hypothetical protein
MLSDASIRAAQPHDKPYKLLDELGLYLLVTPRGARGWRIKYRVGGHEKLLSFAPLPYRLPRKGTPEIKARQGTPTRRHRPQP